MSGAARERVRAALEHREPDRIPFDLGGSRVTGIHHRAYAGLRTALGLPRTDVRVGDITQQLAEVDTDAMDLLGCDVRLVGPRSAAGYRREMVDDGAFVTFRDEWGVGRRMVRDGGLYFDSYGAPLAGEVDAATIDAFPWPDPLDDGRFAGMADAARRASEDEGRAVHVGSICGGLTEGLFKMRGFEDGYMDLAAEPARARRVMERILEIKLAYWERALRELDGLVDIVGEADDLGGQDRPLFSPATYRALVKPLQRELFAFIRARTSGPDLLPHLRRGPGPGPRPDRDRGRHPQPRPGLARREWTAQGSSASSAATWCSGVGESTRSRCSGPGPPTRSGPRSGGASTISERAAGSCSPPSTMSSPTSRPPTSSRCGRHGGRWRHMADPPVADRMASREVS